MELKTKKLVEIHGAMKGLDKILARQAVFSRGPIRQVVEKL